MAMASPLALVAMLVRYSLLIMAILAMVAMGEEDDSLFTVAKQFKRSVQNVAAGEPSSGLWTSRARQRPLPTNKFWQNFVLNRGSSPEYIHPYTIQAGNSSIAIGYPKRQASPTLIAQIHANDLFVSARSPSSPIIQVSHHDDLTVTLSLGQAMRAHLLRGSPYVSFVFSDATPLIASAHAIANLSRSADSTKHTLFLANGQRWVVYSSAPIHLQLDRSAQQLSASGDGYSGVLRIALVATPSAEPLLDRYSGCYAVASWVSIDTVSSAPRASMAFTYKTQGRGDLLLLALPLHRAAMDYATAGARPLPQLRYASIDGELQGVVGSLWKLDSSAPMAAIAWHSVAGIREPTAAGRLGAALARDVAALRPINTSSTYFFGKAVARAARLALIAEEIGAPDQAAAVAAFLDSNLSPWFDGSNAGNAIVYDGQWGGLVSQAGAFDSGADFGLGVYNDHHYHWGYFVYAGAVLAKLDRGWGERYRTNLYSLVGDYMSPAPPRSGSSRANFPRFRHFDPWVMHSWAGGLTEFADGRNQESSSEAVNAYYAAALLGRAYGDEDLANTGSAIAGFEALGAKSLWHIRRDSDLYEPEFVRENRMSGVVWANKRDTALWFAATSVLECRVGIQVIPVTPATEALYDDVDYNRQLYEWASPAVQSDTWRGFALAVQATYDPARARANVELLERFDDGNSLSNMLWWVYTRPSIT
ncbi:putative endo-1,3(4)-beta-glucanase 2 [Selaginella moellendorffii]|uniref:putative endo-1,3(4)-beta-glucanase 2 n=1 Tax=Selaginella moellendorffii TaxID=88036 RepID=UPI000D1C68FE|nr:putative endo-1,3(4)-beta-glucanase 2 [Selaginella moellendorffii]|eukprot:XP_024545150.1 putative endo-1,3(4)-beta-glucanase 2 [Selaginella moellendorffii]